MKFNDGAVRKNKYKKKLSTSKKGRIIVRNIPFAATEKSLKKHFGTFGAIKEINLLRRPDGEPVGCAFIEFHKENDARQAVQDCSGKEFLGRTITAAISMERARYIASRLDTGSDIERVANNGEVKRTDESNNADGEEGDAVAEVNEECMEMKPDVEELLINDLECKPEMTSHHDGSEVAEGTKQKAKHRNKAQSLKKGRVIVRNISFKANEDDMKKHFGRFGELSEVTLLRKPDGKMVGCGFVQFMDKKHAAKAIVECSGKPFLGRPIVLDWAIAKTTYAQKSTSEMEAKVKDEPLSDDDIKQEEEDDKSEVTIKSEDDSDVEAESEDEEDLEEEKDNLDADAKDPGMKKPQKFVSNDVSEGRTVFVKNIPFSAINKNFKECMEQFGDVEYALICYDHLTEHSKGTGFVKFKTQESAQTCLSAGTELTLLGQVLDCHKALDRETIQTKGKKCPENTPSKDSRNLYLVKEGAVLAGSKAAVGVSVTDMAKRLQLEQLKTQMLRSLNMFVSNNRVVLHNVPPSYDNAKLLQLFKENSRPGAFITEAKIMRDMINVDENGIGKSKEMAFVRFTKHEDALQALRKINNNPTIFTASKRPIVSFAIENRMIHKVRQQREQKSRDKNPLYKSKRVDGGDDASKNNAKSRRSRRRAMLRLKKKITKTSVQNEKVAPVVAVSKNKLLAKKPISKKEAQTSKKPFSTKRESKQSCKKEERGSGGGKVEYTGVAAEPGDTKLRTKHSLKAQASLHLHTVRKEMKKKKSHKRLQEQQKIQREQIKQPKQKKGKGKNMQSASEEKGFNELVNKYKSKMTLPLKQKKWYEPDK